MKRQVALLRKGEPDAVICVGAYAACAAFIRDAREADWDVPIANLSFVGSENLLDLLRQHGRGRERDYTADLINSQVVPSYTRSDLPGVQLYRRLMNAYRNTPLPEGLSDTPYQPQRFSFTSLEGFLGARLVEEVLQKLGPNPRRSDVRKTAESLEGVDLGLGEPVSFTAARHQAQSTVYYTVVRERRFVMLTDWSQWKK